MADATQHTCRMISADQETSESMRTLAASLVEAMSWLRTRHRGCAVSHCATCENIRSFFDEGTAAGA